MKCLSAIIFAALALSVLCASAQDLHFDDYRKFLMNGTGAKGTKKMAIQTTCTNSSGQITRVGENSFDLCLAEIQNQANQKSLTGSEAARPSASPSVGTSIHIGN